MYELWTDSPDAASRLELQAMQCGLTCSREAANTWRCVDDSSAQ